MNKKERIFQYKMVAAAAVLPFLISFGLDFIKDKPIFSTLTNIAKWVWNNIFEFELTVWQILLGILFIGLTLVIINRFTKTELDFRAYITDNIKNNEWKWDWQKDSRNGLWDLKNIVPVCPKCKIGMLKKITYSGSFTGTAKCPKCDMELQNIEDPDKIALIILDNVEKNLHLDKIVPEK